MDVNEGSFTTLSCAGDNRLGGEDMDTLVARYVLKDHPMISELLRNRNVRQACGKCREKLTTSSSATVTIEGKEFILTRNELDELLEPFLNRAKELVLKVCGDLRSKVDEVVLVGGVSRTPILRSVLKELFPRLSDLCSSCDPTTTVAEGLSIRGAVHGGVSDKILKSFLMNDVLPLPIGVESFDEDCLEEGKMDVVLERLAKLPAASERVFRCAEIDQKGITVDIYEGESDMTSQNEKVASFSFPLPPRIEGDVHLEHRDVLVKFRMDEAGEFRVVLVDDDYVPGRTTRIAPPDNTEVYLKACIALLGVIYLLFRLFVRPQFEYYGLGDKEL
jgi:molecular chaperone DnaK (HSP70)